MSSEMSSSVTLNKACKFPGLSRLKDLLIVAVAVDPDPAFRFEDMQVHVLHGHEGPVTKRAGYPYRWF
jgi:hypothetical protein